MKLLIPASKPMYNYIINTIKIQQVLYPRNIFEVLIDIFHLYGTGFKLIDGDLHYQNLKIDQTSNNELTKYKIYKIYKEVIKNHLLELANIRYETIINFINDFEYDPYNIITKSKFEYGLKTILRDCCNRYLLNKKEGDIFILAGSYIILSIN